MSPLARSILQTLKYSDHFGFPLTLQEIHLRLISSKPYSSERVLRTLKLMGKKQIIAQTGEYYHFPDRQNLVARRLTRAQKSAPQFAHAKTLSTRLSTIPSVIAIYLTGSLALSNTDSDADIDFMIITRPGRLWTTRLLLTLYTSLLGLRRTPHSTHNSGKLCLNLYLSPLSYLLPPSKRSLYTAYELIQTVPLYDPQNTHLDLLAANSWIYDYLPNMTPGSDLKGRAQPRPSNLRGRSDPQGFMELIEIFCYHLQLFYMRPKLTREYITPDSAFFHPNNPGAQVLKKLKV